MSQKLLESFILLFFLQACKIMELNHYDELPNGVWQVKTYHEPHGPGNNKWGGASVIDILNDQIKLNIESKESRVYCSEIRTIKADYGEGIYSFYFKGAVQEIQNNTVFGIFLLENSKKEPKEIDIEFTRWGNDKNKMLHYSIHHFNEKSTTVQADIGPLGEDFSCFLYCKKNKVYLGVFPGHIPFTKELLLNMHQYRIGGQIGSNYRIHINFWKMPGTTPLGEKETIALNNFEFSPLLDE